MKDPGQHITQLPPPPKPTKMPMCLGPEELYTGKHHNPMPDICDYSSIDKWEEEIREWVRFRLEYQDSHKFDDGIYL